MGWTPDAPSLGLASSQNLISQGGGATFSKKVSVIPLAKSDNLGIGARGGSAAGIGSVRAMGVPLASMGFVSAAGTSGESTPTAEPPKSGGEFGRLLERLNKMKESAAAVITGTSQDKEAENEENSDAKSEKKEKKAKKEKKDKKRKHDQVEEDVTEATSQPTADVSAPSTPLESASPAVTASAVTAILNNPRMAARSKHLRAKRLATSSNSAAMAEILGLAPVSDSAVSSGTTTPVVSNIPSTGLAPTAFGQITSAGAGIGGSGLRSEPLSVNSTGENEGEWPKAPARKFPTFASASSATGLKATFDETTVASSAETSETSTSTPQHKFPSFAKSTLGGIGSTFEASPVQEDTKMGEAASEDKGASTETDREKRKREKAEKKARKEQKRAEKESNPEIDSEPPKKKSKKVKEEISVERPEPEPVAQSEAVEDKAEELMQVDTAKENKADKAARKAEKRAKKEAKKEKKAKKAGKA